MRRFALPLALVAATAGLTACGTRYIDLPEADRQNQRLVEGAELFYARCAGCHTMDIAGAQGGAVNVNRREIKDGPNFNERQETKDQVLYAIRNGGFSSGPMPQNIVVGDEAEKVAEFVSKYAGKNRATASQQARPAGETGEASSGVP